MVPLVLKDEDGLSAVEDLLRPEALPGGGEPEQRLVFCGISWDRYVAFDRRLGDDRPGPRLYYLDGQLEIVTSSNEHERIKKWIGDFMGDYLFQTRKEIVPRGQATMRLALKEAGAEPDESWCIGEEKEFPDLVLEIVLTSGGTNKLEIYQRFEVPEVWFWRRNKLEIYTLGSAGRYEPTKKSQLLPGLDVTLIERCVGIHSWREARETFRLALSKRAN